MGGRQVAGQVLPLREFRSQLFQAFREANGVARRRWRRHPALGVTHRLVRNRLARLKLGAAAVWWRRRLPETRASGHTKNLSNPTVAEHLNQILGPNRVRGLWKFILGPPPMISYYLGLVSGPFRTR